nr:MauE/DoxX family redox-associated membrane protein [uncultured Undibacterium sp.]
MTMQDTIVPVIVLGLACIFFFAAVGKLRSFTSFQNNLTQSFGISPNLSKLIVPILIGTELLIAIALFSSNSSRILQLTLFVASILFLIFSLVVAYQFFSKDLVRCNCFGEAERPVSAYDLMRNFLLLNATIYATYANHHVEINTHMQAPAIIYWLQFGIALTLCLLMMHFHEFFSTIFSDKDY